jgi:hypothetical protein
MENQWEVDDCYGKSLVVIEMLVALEIHGCYEKSLVAMEVTGCHGESMVTMEATGCNGTCCYTYMYKKNIKA